jgi:hypothetical protein
MTLQKEFYANFIVRRLTLKVINMDTLYLVFKDRFQPRRLPLIETAPAPSDDIFSPQAKRHTTHLVATCQLQALDPTVVDNYQQETTASYCLNCP